MSMAKGKAPGHDGMPIEFFQLYWNSIGEDFHKMVNQSIEDGAFHEGITKRLIRLIPKEGMLKTYTIRGPLCFCEAKPPTLKRPNPGEGMGITLFLA